MKATVSGVAEVVAERETLPEMVAPPEGETSVTVTSGSAGGGVAFATVMGRVAFAVTPSFPAVALSEYVPLATEVESQVPTQVVPPVPVAATVATRAPAPLRTVKTTLMAAMFVVAPKVVEPDTVAPSGGAVIATVKAGPPVFETTMLRDSLSVIVPLRNVLAMSEYVPFGTAVESHVAVQFLEKLPPAPVTETIEPPSEGVRMNVNESAAAL